MNTWVLIGNLPILGIDDAFSMRSAVMWLLLVQIAEKVGSLSRSVPSSSASLVVPGEVDH